MAAAETQVLAVIDQNDVHGRRAAETLRRALPAVSFVADAPGLLKLAGDEPGLVIVDGAHRGVDVESVCRQVSATASVPHVPVLYLSPKDDPPSKLVRALDAGACATLSRCVDQDVLAATCRAMLRAAQCGEQARQYLAYTETLIDTIPMPVFLKDRQGRYRGCNKAFAAMVGLQNPRAILGKTTADLLPADAARQHEQRDEDVFTKSGKVVYESELPHADGSVRHYEIWKAAYPVEQGRSKGLVGVLVDITERKGMEDKLRRHMQELELLNEAGARLGRSLDVRSIYDTMFDVVSKVMDCDSLIVSSYDPSDDMIRCVYLRHEGRLVDPKTLPPVPLEREGVGLQSTVIRTGLPMLVSDWEARVAGLKNRYYYGDGKLVRELPPDDVPRTRSGLIVPVLDEGKVVGAVQVHSYRLNAYSEDHLKFLSAFMLQVAAAVTSASLYEQAQREIADRKRAQAQLRDALMKVESMVESTVRAMGKLIESRDPYTAGHQSRVAQLAGRIAEKMGLDTATIRGIQVAALVHDIGKTAVPAEILSKPGKLTTTEFELVKAHPKVSSEILAPIEFPWPVAEAVLQHHERLDGSGYPAGLRDQDIIVEARVIAVADVVEAMAAHRPYRPARGVEAALSELAQHSGVLYDPRVVKACLALFSEGGFVLPEG